MRIKPPPQGRQEAGLHPLLNRLYRARGIDSAGGCSLALSALHSFASLADIESAADLLADCIRGRGSILVVGDYDADGATGSALAVRGLGAMGASGVSYLIPSRFTSGYGLSPTVVDAAAGVRRAHELSIPVIHRCSGFF